MSKEKKEKENKGIATLEVVFIKDAKYYKKGDTVKMSKQTAEKLIDGKLAEIKK